MPSIEELEAQVEAARAEVLKLAKHWEMAPLSTFESAVRALALAQVRELREAAGAISYYITLNDADEWEPEDALEIDMRLLFRLRGRHPRSRRDDGVRTPRYCGICHKQDVPLSPWKFGTSPYIWTCSARCDASARETFALMGYSVAGRGVDGAETQ